MPGPACIPCASVAVANPIIAPIAAVSYAAYKLSNGRKGSKMKKRYKSRNKKLSRKKIRKKSKKIRKKTKKRSRR